MPLNAAFPAVDTMAGTVTEDAEEMSRLHALEVALQKVEHGALAQGRTAALTNIGRVLYHFSTTQLMRVVNRSWLIWPLGVVLTAPHRDCWGFAALFAYRWRTNRRHEAVSTSVGRAKAKVTLPHPLLDEMDRHPARKCQEARLTMSVAS